MKKLVPKKKTKQKCRSTKKALVQVKTWQVLISQKKVKAPIPSAQVKKILKKILKDLGSEHPEISQSELSILFCSDEEIRVLNRDYREKDKPTDVLSFSAIEDSGSFFVGESLGDLVISVPTTIKQAKKYRVAPAVELLRLLIHGILHLFGYDHERVPKSVADKMRRREKALLRTYREEL